MGLGRPGVGPDGRLEGGLCLRQPVGQQQLLAARQVRRGLEGAAARVGRALLQHRLDAPQQVLEAEGLLDVVLGAEGLAGVLGEAPAAIDGGHHHDRHVAGAGGGLDAPAGLEAVDLGQHGVEQDQVRHQRLGHGQGLGAVHRHRHREAMLLERALHQQADLRLVVHHQHGAAGLGLHREEHLLAGAAEGLVLAVRERAGVLHRDQVALAELHQLLGGRRRRRRPNGPVGLPGQHRRQHRRQAGLGVGAAPDQLAGLAGVVGLGDGGLHRRVDTDVDRDLATGDEAHLGEHPLLVGRRHGQVEAAPLVGERQDVVVVGHQARHQVEQGEVHHAAREVDARDAGLLGQHRRQAPLVHAHGEQLGAEPLPARLPLAPGLIDHGLGGHAPLHQQHARRDGHAGRPHAGQDLTAGASMLPRRGARRTSGPVPRGRGAWPGAAGRPTPPCRRRS